MKPADLLDLSIAPAFSILPPAMATPAAAAMMLAIALQESGLEHRRQLSGGPARGWWQFERIGVEGVQRHHHTAEFAAGVGQVLEYRDSEAYGAIEHNDTLAACYARLLLWREPRRLPGGRMESDEGWQQYLKLWGPGKPRPDHWIVNYRTAWDAVNVRKF